MYNTYLYVIANDGVDSAASYSFKAKVMADCQSLHPHAHTAATEPACIGTVRYPLLVLQQSSCSFATENVGAQMSGSVSIKQASEEDLQAAVASVGPVSVAVDGRNKAFRVCV